VSAAVDRLARTDDAQLVVGGEAGQGKGLALARLLLPSALPPTVSISGTVFEDLNGDGKQDDGEAALAGWTVFLDANNNGKLDPGELTAATDSQGNYHFTVTPGTYNIREVLMKGFKAETPSSGVYTIALVGGQDISDQDFENIENRRHIRPPRKQRLK